MRTSHSAVAIHEKRRVFVRKSLPCPVDFLHGEIDAVFDMPFRVLPGRSHVQKNGALRFPVFFNPLIDIFRSEKIEKSHIESSFVHTGTHSYRLSLIPNAFRKRSQALTEARESALWGGRRRPDR